MQEPSLIGWREWVGLPQLGLPRIKAKIDTGARSSSLQVLHIEVFLRDGSEWLRFAVQPQRHSARRIECEAMAVDRRCVTDSGGKRAERWFIRSRLLLAGHAHDVELNLSERPGMAFTMLVGRSALQGRFVVDPQRSHAGRGVDMSRRGVVA